ncbi:MAG: hypothetical protein K8R25_03900 [Methanosarcinales archaeon]|nr:hypothetical protein [Methanosarcinales archaeon]
MKIDPPYLSKDPCFIAGGFGVISMEDWITIRNLKKRNPGSMTAIISRVWTSKATVGMPRTCSPVVERLGRLSQKSKKLKFLTLVLDLKA